MTTTNGTREPWKGMIPVDDTRLAVSDTGGSGRPVVYLNGCYADQSHWRKVIAALGPTDFRHITFDECARGKSDTSTDYSFEGCLRDVDAVVRDRGVVAPIFVGWSYGASVAAYWSARHPGLAAGLVLVDGAMPFGLVGEDGQREIRRLFKRMSWVFPLASRLGLAARMSGSEHAEVNIEANEVSATCGPALDGLTCPVRWVLGTGGHLGARGQVMEEGRALLGPFMERNPSLGISAKVPVGHSKILTKHPDAVVDAVRDVSALTKP